MSDLKIKTQVFETEAGQVASLIDADILLIPDSLSQILTIKLDKDNTSQTLIGPFRSVFLKSGYPFQWRITGIGMPVQKSKRVILELQDAGNFELSYINPGSDEPTEIKFIGAV